MPSVFRDAAGKACFTLPIPKVFLSDLAIKHLIEREAGRGGFEYPTRAFFDAHLQPGDVFIDVGAHWGMLSLSAATRHPGNISVLAIEADPANVTQLLRGVGHNGLTKDIEIVAAAAGDAPGTAPLIGNTTMGHSLYGKGLEGMQQTARGLSVPIVTLDGLLAERQALQGRRVLIKFDVEGFEPQTIAGARNLLQSGRVAALVWEHGRAFFEEPGKSAARELITELQDFDFSLHQLPSHELGGALMPFVAAKHVCNVICLSGQFAPERAYNRPAGPVVRPGPSDRAGGDAGDRARLTQALAEVGEVLDLNQGQFPERAVDIVAALDLLQYIHDVPALLRRCAAAAPCLIFSYPLAATGGRSSARREEGWFNDFDESMLTGMLHAAG